MQCTHIFEMKQSLITFSIILSSIIYTRIHPPYITYGHNVSCIKLFINKYANYSNYICLFIIIIVRVDRISYLFKISYFFEKQQLFSL